MKIIMTTLAILAASPAISCDSVLLHVASYHTDRDLIKGVNETNLGLGCGFGVTENISIEGGFYENSYSDMTVYGIAALKHSSGLGVYAGIASGYQDDIGVADHGVTGVAGFVYSSDIMTIRVAPSYNGTTGTKGAVVALSINIGG